MKKIFVVEIKRLVDDVNGKIYRKVVMADSKEQAQEDVIDMFNNRTLYLFSDKKYSIVSYDFSTAVGRDSYNYSDFQADPGDSWLDNCNYECWACPWCMECETSQYGM